MQSKDMARPRPRMLFLFAALLCAGALFIAVYRVYYQTAYPIRFEELVREQSERNDLPPALVFAVIRTESGFRTGVQSSVGARGLMQLTEETFDWVMYRTDQTGLSFEEMYDPARNIEYGTALIRLLLDEFGSVESALCAYHAGWGNATKWLQDPEYSLDGYTIHNIPFGDTERYVKKVIATQDIYQSLYHFE